MKNSKVFLGVALFATVLFSSCGENNGNDPDNPVTEAGVMINGIKWANEF